MSEINIVKINAALPGMGLTGNFIIDVLKVPPARQEKRALFWNLSDWPLICKRLTEHVARGAAMDLAKLSGERPLPKPRTEPAAGGDPFFDDAAPAAAGDDFFGGEAEAPAAGDDFFG